MVQGAKIEHKRSRKRELIRSYLAGTKEHPGAEQIYSELKPICPELSLATVYRNLALFLEEGEVMCVTNVAGQERYDFNTANHPHFICEKCRRVIDIEARIPEGEELREVSKSNGIEAKSCIKLYYGLCDRCR